MKIAVVCLSVLIEIWFQQKQKIILSKIMQALKQTPIKYKIYSTWGQLQARGKFKGFSTT